MLQQDDQQNYQNRAISRDTTAGGNVVTIANSGIDTSTAALSDTSGSVAQDNIVTLVNPPPGYPDNIVARLVPAEVIEVNNQHREGQIDHYLQGESLAPAGRVMPSIRVSTNVPNAQAGQNVLATTNVNVRVESGSKYACERVEAIVSRYMRVEGKKPPITYFFRVSFGDKYLTAGKADCRRLDFQSGTNLSHADFSGSDCSTTRFVEVILKNVSFKDTLLHFAEITNADGLTVEQLSEAIYDTIIVDKNDTKDNKNIRDRAKILRLERLNKATQDSIDILEKFISFFPKMGDKDIIAMIRSLPPEKVLEMQKFLTSDVRNKLFEILMVSSAIDNVHLDSRGYGYGGK